MDLESDSRPELDQSGVVNLAALHDCNLFGFNYCTSGYRKLQAVAAATGRSVHRRPAAAPLVLLSRAAGARIVPPDLGSIAPWFTRVCTRTDLPMRPEIAVRPQQPSRHVHDDFFALLGADRLGGHLRFFIRFL